MVTVAPKKRQACLEMAATQDCLFTIAQAYAAGYGEKELRNAVAAGRYQRELPGVLAVPGCPRTWRRNLRAVTMWGGPGAAASHRSAARLWGLNGFRSDQPEVSITRWKSPNACVLPDGTLPIIHRVDRYVGGHVTEIEGIPTTSVARTIMDLGGIGDERLEAALDSALTKRLMDLGQICRLVEEQWMQGRRGVRIVRDLLIPRVAGQAPTHSDLEILMKRVIDRFQLPEAARQYPVSLPFGPIHIDFAYPETMLAIETDSYAWHLNRRAFEKDRERDNELRALGWTVLRFTWAMLRFQPERVAAFIRQALDDARTAVPS